jgi:hypothetical protein
MHSVVPRCPTLLCFLRALHYFVSCGPYITLFPAGLLCRYFDAARSYGRAEEFLGGWLAARGIGPQEVVVGSKWGYVYTANWQGRIHKVL